MKTQEERQAARTARAEWMKISHDRIIAKAKARADARPKAKPKIPKARVPDHAVVVIQR
jgi:hypothetical protein